MYDSPSLYVLALVRSDTGDPAHAHARTRTHIRTRPFAVSHIRAHSGAHTRTAPRHGSPADALASSIVHCVFGTHALEPGRDRTQNRALIGALVRTDTHTDGLVTACSGPFVRRDSPTDARATIRAPDFVRSQYAPGDRVSFTLLCALFLPFAAA